MFKVFKGARTNERRGNSWLIFHPECGQLGWRNTLFLRQIDHSVAYLYAWLGNSLCINAATKRAELAPFRWTQFVSSRQQFKFQWTEIAKDDIMGRAIRKVTNRPSNLVDAFLEMMPGLLSHLVYGRRARQHMLLV